MCSSLRFLLIFCWWRPFPKMSMLCFSLCLFHWENFSIDLKLHHFEKRLNCWYFIMFLVMCFDSSVLVYFCFWGSILFVWKFNMNLIFWLMFSFLIVCLWYECYSLVLLSFLFISKTCFWSWKNHLWIMILVELRGSIHKGKDEQEFDPKLIFHHSLSQISFE